MDEVLQDSSWLDKQWVEKDRLLGHFCASSAVPRPIIEGFGRHRAFDSRSFQVESSVLSLVRLMIIPLFVPIMLLLAIPIFWVVLWLWVCLKSYQILNARSLTVLGLGVLKKKLLTQQRRLLEVRASTRLLELLSSRPHHSDRRPSQAGEKCWVKAKESITT